MIKSREENSRKASAGAVPHLIGTHSLRLLQRGECYHFIKPFQPFPLLHTNLSFTLSLPQKRLQLQGAYRKERERGSQTKRENNPDGGNPDPRGKATAGSAPEEERGITRETTPENIHPLLRTSQQVVEIYPKSLRRRCGETHM
ncbi:hypothetical protein QQF64_031393 [Cirrhinus molitorella]|uniref:Uncharacterized protein n=1 Tax=Cirrhinus molitorella TaxID=172907 RepID=A0ABR3MWU0_9TELE